MKRKRLDDQKQCQILYPHKPLYEGILTGKHLHQIAKAGWSEKDGCPVVGVVTPTLDNPQQQMLKIALPWPPPEPHAPDAPIFIWLQGENRGRATQACIIDESGCP